MENPPKISVLVLTQNSEKTLMRTLESVKVFDEVLVIDGGSTDMTEEISHSCLARFISHPFTGFAEQRNFAISQAEHDWCLFVDSDEAVTPELAKELYLLAEAGEFPLYRVMRTEYMLGKEIESGHGRSGYQERFFKKDLVQYAGEVHEYPLVDGKKPSLKSGSLGSVNASFRLLHNPNVSVEDFVSKMGKYSILKAREKVSEGRQTNALTVFFIFPFTFFQIFLKSLSQGRVGFVASMLEGLHRAMVKLLVYEETVLKKSKRQKD